MWNRLTFVSMVVGAFVAQAPIFAQSASFQMIPGALEANDMSPDGRWIVGTIDSGGCGPAGAYRYDAEQSVMLPLPAPGFTAVAVSDDGKVVLGNMPDPASGDQVAGIWRESTNEWESLGFLPGASADLCGLSTAYELNGDGTVAVGLSWVGCESFGFIWTEATGMQPLEGLANGVNRASVVSADGALVGGFAQGSFSRTPATWTSSLDGTLLDPPFGDMQGEIQGMRDDGSLLLGKFEFVNGQPMRAATWTLEDGFVQVGAGSVFGAWTGNAFDIADDGTIIGFDTFLTSRNAWILPSGATNLEQLKGYALSLGANIPANLQIEVPQAISADGSRIIGHGFCSGAWIMDFASSPACGADLNGDGVVNGADLAALLSAWGSTDSPADLNGDGIVDGADLATMLSLWNMIC